MRDHASFEIHVALLGNILAGKRTILNAILCNKYGKTSLKWCMAGVTNFWAHTMMSCGAVDDGEEA